VSVQLEVMRTAETLNIRIAIVLAAVFTAALVALTLWSGAPDRAFAAAGKCPKAKASTRDATRDQLAAAVECLIGKARRRADLKQLDSVGSLERVANKHSEVMVKEDCLDHRCGDEKTLKRRIVRSGYPIPGGRYGFGEITGCALTPKEMVTAWMQSQVHRRRILGKSYRDIGVGADKGKPNVAGCVNGLRGVYTVIFAWRKG